MISDGDLAAQRESTGEYRWVYTTVNGAMRLGPRLYKTRAGALSAGKKWLAEQRGMDCDDYQ